MSGSSTNVGIRCRRSCGFPVSRRATYPKSTRASDWRPTYLSDVYRRDPEPGDSVPQYSHAFGRTRGLRSTPRHPLYRPNPLCRRLPASKSRLRPRWKVARQVRDPLAYSLKTTRAAAGCRARPRAHASCRRLHLARPSRRTLSPVDRSERTGPRLAIGRLGFRNRRMQAASRNRPQPPRAPAFMFPVSAIAL